MLIPGTRRLAGIVIFSLMLAVTAGMTFAQATPTETFTSTFHDLTFQYPADWLVQEAGANEVVIANSAEALAQVEEEFATPIPGTVLVRLNVTAPSISGDQWTPVEMLQELTTAMSEAMSGLATFSDIEPITIGNLNGARMTLSSEMLGFETLMLTAETGNRMVTFVSATTGLGELASFEQDVLDLLASASTEATDDPVAPVGNLTVIGQLSGNLATYASSLADFTFQYPAEWVLADVSEDDNRVRLTNIAGAFSEGGVTPGLDFDYPTGSIWMALRGSPADGLTIRGLANGAGMILAPYLGSDGVISDPVSVTVGGKPGYRVTASSQSEDVDLMLLVFENGPMISTILAATSAGELQSFEPQIMAIAESIEPVSGQVVLAVTPTATPRPVKGQITGPAQPTVQPLAYGQVANAELVSGQTGQWTFTAEAGDVVSIRMTADFDNYLEVYDSSNALVDSDDDSGGNFNALIQSLAVPASGTYTIVARGYDPQASGPYTLELTQETLATPGALAAGDIVSANLAGEFDEWTFQGAAGESVSILLTGEFDTLLDVFAPDGSLLATSDDLLVVNVSFVENLTLPAAGVYVIHVRSYSEDEQGLYLLSLGQTP